VPRVPPEGPVVAAGGVGVLGQGRATLTAVPDSIMVRGVEVEIRPRDLRTVGFDRNVVPSTALPHVIEMFQKGLEKLAADVSKSA
jgi:hypothetical protein